MDASQLPLPATLLWLATATTLFIAGALGVLGAALVDALRRAPMTFPRIGIALLLGVIGWTGSVVLLPPGLRTTPAGSAVVAFLAGALHEAWLWIARRRADVDPRPEPKGYSPARVVLALILVTVLVALALVGWLTWYYRPTLEYTASLT